MHSILQRLAAIALAMVVLSGCQLVGPPSIRLGRGQYNDIIQSTTKQQMFQNLVRVQEQEPTLFLDVTEVDAAVSLQGQSTFGISNIGASRSGPATVGSIGGMASYSENPTIRYFPLTGPSLVQQILSPITPQTLAYLYEQNFPWVTVLQLTSRRLTPGYEDWGIALNAIGALDNYGALDIWAKASIDALSPDLKSFGPADTLVLFLKPEHPRIESNPNSTMYQDQQVAKKHIWRFWLRLLRLYEDENGTVASTCKTRRITDKTLVDIDKSLDRADESELYESVKCLTRRIELRSSAATEKDPVPTSDPLPDGKKTRQNAQDSPAPAASAMPILQTNSALGVLEQGLQSHGIRFIDPSETDRYVIDCGTYYMTAPSASAPEDSKKSAERKRIDTLIASKFALKANVCDLISLHSDDYLDVRSYEAARAEKLFAVMRAFILVKKGNPPADAYVSYTDSKGQSFYISGDDKISQVNFLLISQLLTMQAVPSQAGSLVPTVSVGGH